MKTFVAIISLVLAILTLTSLALSAENPLAHGYPVGQKELAESSKTRVLWRDPVSGKTIPAWREHRVWLTHVWEQNQWGVKTPAVRRRMEITFTDMKGNLLSEGGVAQPMGTTALPDPEPPPVVVNVCNPCDRGYSYGPSWWGGGGGMYQSGGMYTDGGMSTGGSVYAGGQVTSGLAHQEGYSGNVSTTWLGGGMQTGGGSANYSRNSWGGSSWSAGGSVSARARFGTIRQEVHSVNTLPGSKVRVYSNRPVPDHRSRR